MEDRLLDTIQEEFRIVLEKSSSSNERRYQFPQGEKLAKVAIGMRRAGKTYFLFQTMRQLLARGVSIDRLFYFNFEDDRLQPIDQKKMGEWVDAFYAQQPKRYDEKCFLFFDEVQNVEGWPLVIRRLLDTKDVEIFLTGSSAKLLSREIATSLRGRSLSIEIQPYDFSEYLSANGVSRPVPPFGRKLLDQYTSHLMEFFQKGGFPGVQTLSLQERTEMLQSYVDVVVFRDIVERHKVSNVPLLKYFINTLLKNVGSRFSINKFYNDIHSQGHRIGKDTLYNYLEHLEDAFLLYSIPVFTESMRVLETTPKKIYAVDNGLINASTFNLSLNSGKLLENQVYLDLRRQRKEIFYYVTSDGYEVDFVTKDQQGNYEIIKVVWDQSDSVTFEREVRALKAAETELGITGKIIDRDTYLTSLGGSHRRVWQDHP